MKVRKNLKYIVISLVTTILFLVPVIAWADEDDLLKTVGFTYQIEHPENQIGEGGALNLKMTPGQKQVVTVALENIGEEELTVNVVISGARTNGHGVIEYGPNDLAESNSMVYDLPDLVEVPNQVILPAKQKIGLDLLIEIPQEGYEGIVTGGIELQEETGESEEATDVMIVNKIAYLFGVTLSTGNREGQPHLELAKVYPGQINYRNAILVDLSNSVPRIQRNLYLDVEITKKNQNTVMYSSRKSNMEMAPHSLMSYPVSLNGEKMVAGKYTAHLSAGDGTKTWDWQEDFTITDEEADLFNSEDVQLVQERSLNWQMIIIVTSLLLFIIISVNYGLARRKKS